MNAGTPEFTLWAIRKGDRIASCRQRSAPIGFELRFFVGSKLVHAQVFRDEQALRQMAEEKRVEFQARG